MLHLFGLLSSLAVLGVTLGKPTPDPGSLTRRGAPLYSANNTQVGVFYEASDDGKCDASFGEGWSSLPNTAIPACEYALVDNPQQFSDLKTNRLVSLSGTWVDDPDLMASYCGKEVQITLANGTIFKFDEGPLVLWNGCSTTKEDFCSKTVPLDLSASAWLAMTGASDSECSVSPKISFEVLDTQVWEPVKDGKWAGPTDVSASSALPSQTHTSSAHA